MPKQFIVSVIFEVEDMDDRDYPVDDVISGAIGDALARESGIKDALLCTPGNDGIEYIGFSYPGQVYLEAYLAKWR